MGWAVDAIGRRVHLGLMSERSGSEEKASTAAGFRVGMALPTLPTGTRRPAVAAAAVRVKLGVFCRALAGALANGPALSVAPRTFTSYGQLLEAVHAGEVDLAWLPPRVAARAAAEERITPLVVPLRGEHAWYATALFSAPGSSIRTIGDLKGVRAAWVDPESMAGHVVIRAWLRSQGVDLEAAFSEEGFLGGHDQVVAAVLEGRVDVGATFAHQEPDGDRIVSAGWGKAQVQVIAVAGRIPADVLAAKSGADAAVINGVREALTGDMDGELRGAALALFEADRFVDADEASMRSLSQLVAHLDD
jgi:phosphate/phosphite/phosphonate ABC transporter binding protein